MSTLSKPHRFALALALFFLSFTGYLLSYSGDFHSSDEVSMYAVTESLVQRGELDINKIAWMHRTEAEVGRYGPSGDVYSYHSVAQSLIGIPLYALARLQAGVGNVQAVMLTNAIVTAATNALLLLLVLRLGYSVRVGLAVGLLHGFASLAWPYAKTFFSEPLGALLVVGAVCLWVGYRDDRRTALMVGLGSVLGALAVVKLSYLILAPAFVAATAILWWRERRALDSRLVSASAALGAPLVAALALLGAYNQFRFGSPLETGYPSLAFDTSFLVGLSGLLISPGRGLLLYSPVVLLGLAGAFSFLKRDRLPAFLLFALIAVYIGFFAKWYVWWRGVNWGPRYLVPIVPLFLILSAPVLAKALRPGRWALRAAAGGVAAVSVAIQAAAVAANYLLYSIHLRESLPGIQMDLRPLYDPAYSPLLQQLDLLWPLRSDLFLFDASGVTDWPLLLALSVALLAWGGCVAWLQRPGGKRWGWLATGALAAVGLSSSVILGGALLTRACRPPSPDYVALVEELRASARPSDAIVAVTPYHYHMNHYKLDLPVYGLELSPELDDLSTGLLRKAMADHGRLWLVTAGVPPADPSNGVERLLCEESYKAGDRWIGEFRLCPLGTSEESCEAGRPGARIEGLATLYRSRICRGSAGTGRMLEASLTWRVPSDVARDYTAFVHAIGEDGALYGQSDSSPLGGYRPTSTWRAGEDIEDRVGIQLRPDAPPGRYTLVVGMYGADGARVPVSGPGADPQRSWIVLGAIEVGASGEVE